MKALEIYIHKEDLRVREQEKKVDTEERDTGKRATNQVQVLVINM